MSLYFQFRKFYLNIHTHIYIYIHINVNNRSCELQINNLNNRFEIIVLKFTTKKDIHEYTVSVFLLHFILYVATLYMFYDQFL